MVDKLVRLFLKNSLFLNLMTIVLLGYGAVKFFEMRREAFPSVDFDIVSISTPYPGASPGEVEEYVTNLIEEELETISGLDEVSSSSIEGFSLIVIKLDPEMSDYEKATAVSDIQLAVDRIRTFPKEVTESPLVKEIKSGDMPVIEIGLSGDMPYRDLHAVADQLKDRIRRLGDAKDARRNGFREKEFWVELDPQKLKEKNVSLNLVIGMLANSNVNLPGGILKSKGGELLVRTIGAIDSSEDIDNIVLRTNDAGISLRIKDIGKTQATFEEETKYFRVNATTSITLLVTKKATGDIITLVDDVKEIVEDYKKKFPLAQKLEVSYMRDISVFVRNRLGVLLNNGLFGIILVGISLLIFLSKGIALVTAFGMPVAFVGALVVMYWTGMTINLITMFALIIVLGMLVDDAIIVAENIWQHYEKGDSPFEAAVNGAKEVMLPVTATILTSIAAFSPMLFVDGIFGKFIQNLPWVVIIALMASLAEAMMLLPSHAFDVLKMGERFAWKGKKKDSKKSGFFDTSISIYRRMLSGVVSIRYIFLLMLLAALAGTGYLAKNHMKQVLFPSDGVEAFFIRLEKDIGTQLDATSDSTSPIEKWVMERIPEGELQNTSTVIGVHENNANDPLRARGSHLSQVGVFLTPELERVRSADEIIESIRHGVENLAKEKGFKKVAFLRVKQGPPVGKPVAIRVSGKSLEENEAAADYVQELLASYEGVSDISENYFKGKDELRIVVNKQKASEFLLSVRDIATHIRVMLEGQVASYVQDKGERIAIRVRFNEQDRSRVSSISEGFITNSAGNMIPLSAVVSLERKPGISAIVHLDNERTITVSANVDESITSSTAVNQAFEKEFAGVYKKFPGVHLSAGGEYEDTQQSMSSLRGAFIFALIMIFVILTVQFGSFTQPFVVMAAIPFGMIGVIIAFYFHDLPISFLGVVGAIGLSGVVVNDSIVLVDFINKAREKGMAVKEAIVHASGRRFRAVWLTSLTTVSGLLPLAYGIGGFDKFLRPAAIALGYGLLFATILILFFVPALYAIRIDLFNLLRRFFNIFGLKLSLEK